MKQCLVKNNLIKAFGIFIFYSILVVGLSIYFIYDNSLIGPIYIFLSIIGIFTLKISEIPLRDVYPDIIFGIIDNGVLIFTIILGDKFAGAPGAVLGGAAGNTLTDGFGGLIEGKVAQKLKHDSNEENRTPLSTMMGKTIGCLLGAGIGLTIVWVFNLLILSFLG